MTDFRNVSILGIMGRLIALIDDETVRLSPMDVKSCIADGTILDRLLVLGRRLERDTILTLELATAGSNSPTLLFARVVRVQAQGFGHWFIGCKSFVPLSDENLQALLEPGGQAPESLST
jgi:hypothetical protein